VQNGMVLALAQNDELMKRETPWQPFHHTLAQENPPPETEKAGSVDAHLPHRKGEGAVK